VWAYIKPEPPKEKHLLQGKYHRRQHQQRTGEEKDMDKWGSGDGK
jgi:hypothetical protein